MTENKKTPLSVVKIGGNIVDNPIALKSFLEDFRQMDGKKLLVHGGGVMASKVSAELGIETRMVNGRRVTDEETLKVVTMVYAGWINKTIVATLQGIGCNAIGLTGADGNVIPSVRRSPVPIDFGFVGDPDPAKTNGNFISQLLENDVTPVFCAITHDGQGSLLNTNADTVAYTVAAACSSNYQTTLYYCFEKEGVLKDINDPDSIISAIDRSAFEQYRKDGIIADGMIPKLENSFRSMEKGVDNVVILHAKNLLTGKGTVLLRKE